MPPQCTAKLLLYDELSDQCTCDCCITFPDSEKYMDEVLWAATWQIRNAETGMIVQFGAQNSARHVSF